MSLALGGVLLTAPVQAATFTVNSTSDADDPDLTAEGTCDSDPGVPVVCTLREAIREANALAGLDTINFNIPPGGLQTITPGSAYLGFTSPVIVNGTTQPGFVSAPIIQINGTGAGGLFVLNLGVGSAGSTIRGLVINRSPANAIRIFSINNVIAGNYLGTNAAGTAPSGNAVGVYVQVGGNTNRIGGTVAADRNVISGNTVDGIQLDGAGGGALSNLVQGNYIGLNAAGTAAVPNGGQGVSIFNGADNNTIGGTALGAGNVISGNGNIGIAINNAGTTGNLVQGNLIGTDWTGALPVGNVSRGVSFDQSSQTNTVGGTVAGAGNTIAFNGTEGVWMGGATTVRNAVLGNAIFSNGGLGIDLNGNGFPEANDTGDADAGPNNLQNHPVLSAAMTNGAGRANFAGSLNGAASTTFRVEFFASAAGDPSGYGEGERYLGFTNVTTNAAGNAIIGVTLVTSLTAGELVTATATDPLNNTSEFGGARMAVASLVVTTTADTVDGTTTSVSALIAAPGADGRISLREAMQAANGAASADTIRFGIPLTDANHLYYRDDLIAGSLTSVQVTTLADSTTPSSPAITDFDPDYPAGLQRSWYRITPTSNTPLITAAVVFDGSTQPGALVNGPVIEVVGTSAGALARGFAVTPATPSATFRGLIVNQFGREGITASAPTTTVQGCYIGTDPSGTLARGNAVGGTYAGVYLAGDGSQVGGLTLAERNVIAGNNSTALWIDADTVTVQGNYIGTSVTGASLGNGGSGVVLQPVVSPTVTNVTIGGVAPGSRNVVSGNVLDGIQLSGAGAQNNFITGNYIGTDVTGSLDLGNGIDGVRIESGASLNTIGGTVPAARNIISGNDDDGVFLGSGSNVVQGNYIGTDVTGTLPLGNLTHGIQLGPVAGNTIGGSGAGAGNVIAHNGARGIRTAPTALTGNSFLGNSIHSNGGLGIDLAGDGVTFNDPNDVDTGPNDLLNFPLITAAFESGGTLTVHFKLDVPAGSYRVEFFKNPSGADASTFGEGQAFASWTNVTDPGGGAVFYNHSFTGSVGDVITTTTTLCTDGAACAAFGSSSEFSRRIASTTAVTLLSFTAQGRDRGVDLAWTTASELFNLGFHLYRAEGADGPFTRVTTSLIPGLGSSATGRSYSYRDVGLLNGRTYFYKLEDVDATGRTELHGPVSARPAASSADSDPAASGRSYGDPASVVLREVERSPRHVVLELLTGGFVATPAEGGQVRLTIPGFESVSRPGEPELPMRRAMVEAVAGRKVRLASVVSSDLLRFQGLRPSSAGSPDIEVDEEGMVLPGRMGSQEGRAFSEVYPKEWARLLGTSFQEETKKAEVHLFPLRWDGGSLLLSRRLVVRLEFSGIEAGETSRGGSRGRRAVKRGSHLRSGVVAQLVVKERGVYRVGYEELFPTPAGRRSRGMLASGLRLSRQGESVAFHVEPAGTFGPGSSLYFLSEGSALNPYADAVYELETSGRGLPMEEESLSSLSTAVLEHFALVEREENQYYQAGLLEAPDLWLWDLVVSPGTKSFPFTADQLSPSSSAAHLSVVLQAASDFETPDDHHVRVGVNGVVVGEGRWDGKVQKTLETEIPAGVLREGENTFELESVGDTPATYSLIFLNRFSVSYPRRLVANQGMLEGRFETSGQATLAGGSTSSVLLDTTGVPRWLRGLQDAASAVSSAVQFPVMAGKSYLLTSSFLSPEVRLLEPSTLKDATNQADYLLLAPTAFLEAAQPLLDLRQSQGLKTKAVSLEEVFAQFGHGETSPLAIKEFLEYAYQFWADPSPRYVLLLGDASYDPKNYLKTGVKDWLPGFPMKTSFLWTVSDPAYAAVNGEDLLPDLALGRLSAGSVEEAQRLIQKVLAFENGGGNFDGAAVLVADNADLAGNFEQDANEIAQTLLAAREPRKIYYSQLGSATRASIIDAFDQGASLMSYVGHGGTVIWASENIFNIQDVARLAPQPRQPLVMTLNCLNGFFHFPPLNSLSEAFVKAEGKGAIAAFSPSGLSVNDAAHLFHKALLQEILSGSHERVGDAVLAAQKAYADSGAFPELLSIYNLFGDPALRID